MKKIHSSRLWLRIPCTIFTIIGVIVLIFLVVALMDNPSGRRHRKFERSLSPVVKEVSGKKDQNNLVNSKTGKTIIKDITVDMHVSLEDSLCHFIKDGKRGFVNLNTGHVDIAPQYDHAWIFSEGLAAVVQGDKLGFIHPDGSIAIPLQFAYNKRLKRDYLFLGGYCVVADSTEQFGLIDTLGNWVIQPAYDKIAIAPDYVVASKTGEFNQQIAYDGHIINDRVIENVFDLHYDINVYDQDYGCDAERTITNQRYFKYAVYGRMGLMDQYGHFITPPIYTELYGFGPKLFRAILQDEHSEVIIDQKGHIISNQ